MTTNQKQKTGFILLILFCLLLTFTHIFTIYDLTSSIETERQYVIGRTYLENPDLSFELMTYYFSAEEDSDVFTAASKAAYASSYSHNGLDYIQNNFLKNTLLLPSAIIFFLLVGFIIFLCFRRFFDSSLKNECLRLRHELRTLSEKYEAKCKSSETYSRQLKDFVENIAHQLKTPISNISLSLDLLCENADSNTTEKVNECFLQIDSIKKLLRNLLDIARLEAGKVIFNKSSFSLNAFLSHVASLQGNSIALNCPDDCTVYGDYDWLEEAFTNLIKNALDITDDKACIYVTAKDYANYTCIEVHDNGKGFSEEDFPHLFDRFYTKSKDGYLNTGIGLNLVKLIIDSHFGNISAENAPGGGAVFTITLPKFALKNKF